MNKNKTMEKYITPKNNMSIKLDANENPYNILEDFLDEFTTELKTLSVNRYPCTDSDELRMLLSEKLDLKPQNIMCGNGSDELIQIIINRYLGKDGNVVIHIPTFTMYKVFTEIAGGTTVEVPPESDFTVDSKKIIQEANRSNANIIFLCNPNNPTGFAFPRKDIIEIIENTNAYVVVDEAYYEFLDETVIDLINTYEKLIVLRTMSKAMALAGARIGYAISSEKTMKELYMVKSPYNLNVFSQILGKLYLKNSQAVKSNIDKIKEQRSYLEEKLEKINGLQVYNSKGNYILFKSNKSDEILERSKSMGISLRDFQNTPFLENCIRISIGTDTENQKILELLRKVVD